MKTLATIGLTLLVTVLVDSHVLIAQSHSLYTIDSVAEKSQLRVSLRYTSDYLYMGRADSAMAPYLSASIGYYHKSGFFVRSGLSYLIAKGEGRIDMISMVGGYEYYKKKLFAGTSLSQYFFSDESYNVMAEMNTYLNAFAGYDLSVVTLYTDISIGFSDGTDIFLGIELDRTFYMFNYKLLITPSVSMNAGSQNYYSQYVNYRNSQTGAWGGKGKGGGGQPGGSSSQTIEVQESDKFKILDYEAAIDLTYKIRNIRLFASSTWTLPVNPATLVDDQGEYTENLSNRFYWSTGVRIIF